MIANSPAPAFDAFRAAVMRDADAQQMLAEQIDPARFEALALEYAAGHNIAITREMLASRAVPLSASSWPPTAWLPVRLITEGEPAVEWLHFAGCKPQDPFYDDSLRRAAARPFNRLFRYRTPLDAFVAGAEDRNPSGLIFHMSRCGSTLVAQMLGAAPCMVALSEPEPFDALLQLPLEPEVHVPALRAMAAALGRGHRHYFLKTDAWHTLAMPLLAKAFPDVPWIFLYRDPIEVLVSHARLPGRQTVPGLVPALDSVGTGHFGLDHAAQILARICKAVVDQGTGPNGMLVHYRELPEALFTRILQHFRIEPSHEAQVVMAAAGARDAKAPTAAFAPDGQAKRQEAGDQARSAARHLAAAYAQLEAIRAASPPAAA